VLIPSASWEFPLLSPTGTFPLNPIDKTLKTTPYPARRVARLAGVAGDGDAVVPFTIVTSLWVGAMIYRPIIAKGKVFCKYRMTNGYCVTYRHACGEISAYGLIVTVCAVSPALL